MAVPKVIEISSESVTGFDDAVKQGLERAASRLRAIKSARIKDQTVEVTSGHVTHYRVNMLVTLLSGD